MRAAFILWVVHSIVAINQLINAIFLFGYPDETMSSRMNRNREHCRVCRAVCRFLNVILFQQNHCGKATDNKRMGRYLPPELRPATPPLLEEADHVDLSGNSPN